LLWDLILRHTSGDFIVDAPGYVFPVSFEDSAPLTVTAGLVSGRRSQTGGRASVRRYVAF